MGASGYASLSDEVERGVPQGKTDDIEDKKCVQTKLSMTFVFSRNIYKSIPYHLSIRLPQKLQQSSSYFLHNYEAVPVTIGHPNAAAPDSDELVKRGFKVFLIKFKLEAGIASFAAPPPPIADGMFSVAIWYNKHATPAGEPGIVLLLM